MIAEPWDVDSSFIASLQQKSRRFYQIDETPEPAVDNDCKEQYPGNGEAMSDDPHRTIKAHLQEHGRNHKLHTEVVKTF